MAPSSSTQVTRLETARSGRRKASRKQPLRSPNRASFHPVPSEHKPTAIRSAYLPGLDGLRALAVIAVLVYHARPAWLTGGFLGVEVFFVISGFIITRALLNEVDATGRIGVRAFWMRRARRLLPAVALLLAGTLTYALAFDPDRVTELRKDALAASLYVTNWHLITADQSYFDTFQQPSTLKHLWSLAVEEQFYVVWPILLAAGLPILKRRGMLVLILIGIAASTAGMALLFDPAGDSSRVYYGTDTRAAALLAGAALAFVAGGWRMANAQWAPKMLALIGFAGMSLLLGATVWLDERQALLYRGGFLAVSLTTAVVILAATQPTLFSKALSVSPLRWIGVRSYGIYLWHWPIYMLVWPNQATLGELAAQITATVLIAALSYALLEKPVREGAIGRLWNSARGWSSLSLRHQGGLVFGASSTAAIVIGLVAASVAARPPELPDYFEMQSIRLHSNVVAADASSVVANSATMTRVQSTLSILTRKPGLCPDGYVVPAEGIAGVSSGLECPLQVSMLHSALESMVASRTAVPEPTPPLVVETPPPAAEPQPEATPPPTQALAAPIGQPVSPPAPMVTAPRVTAIGDSVMLGAAYSLAASVPGIDIDAVVGRQAAATVALVQERVSSNMLGEVVLIHAGNNGPIYPSHIDEIMQLAGPSRRVIFLNVTVPRAWQEPNNAALASTLAKYPNAILLDWHGASEANPALIYNDGIHLTSSGAAQYAGMVIAAIGQ